MPAPEHRESRKESTGTVERCARAMAAQNDEPEMWRAYEEGARACLDALVNDDMIEAIGRAYYDLTGRSIDRPKLAAAVLGGLAASVSGHLDASDSQRLDSGQGVD